MCAGAVDPVAQCVMQLTTEGMIVEPKTKIKAFVCDVVELVER